MERGHLYGKEAIKSFLEAFKIKAICHAKQVVMDGYELFSDSTELITLFSVPNYRAKYANDGAVMQLSDTLTVSFLILENPIQTNASSEENACQTNSHQNHQLEHQHYEQLCNLDTQSHESNQSQQECS
ncbi:unnamed protein product [Echinostoma caproni]|uniref:protein-serine/threonine phosphatase n=1 Tax=Echinostoma caproni TaxID=27848 RepID=A0A183ADX5_9TREM|nr:unnamed protein product [Echinostoma caproni]